MSILLSTDPVDNNNNINGLLEQSSSLAVVGLSGVGVNVVHHSSAAVDTVGDTDLCNGSLISVKTGDDSTGAGSKTNSQKPFFKKRARKLCHKLERRVNNDRKNSGFNYDKYRAATNNVNPPTVVASCTAT